MCTVQVLRVEYRIADGGAAVGNAIVYMTGGPKNVYVVIAGADHGFAKCFNYRVGLPDTITEIEELSNSVLVKMGLNDPKCKWLHTIRCVTGVDRRIVDTLVLDTWTAPRSRL